MAVSVTNLSTLQTVTADAKKLRYVESEKAWFWSDPSSIEAADGISIIAPNTGVGKWYKLYAREVAPSGWTWTVITTAPTTVTATNKQAFACRASSNNVITINLPTSPSAGNSVRIKKLDASGWSRRITVGRNGSNINGVAGNVAISIIGMDVEFTYIDSTTGWTSSQTVQPESSAVSLVYVSGGDTNGVFNYIGTNKNTAAFANPVTVGSKVVLTANPSTESDFTGGGSWADRTTNDLFLTTNNSSYPILIYLGRDTPRSLRLQTLSIQNTNGSGGADGAWRNFKIQGGYSSAVSNPASNTQLFNRPAWEDIITFSNDTTMTTTLSVWCAYTINAAKFYDMFRIIMTGPNAAGSTAGFWRMSEMELYGDLIW